MLRHSNKWFRQTALRIFHDRRDTSLVPKLAKLVEKNSGQFALECFWALNASGGFTDEVALQTLEHKDEHVRAWTVRLLGDRFPPARYSSSAVVTGVSDPGRRKTLALTIQKKLEALARTEPSRKCARNSRAPRSVCPARTRCRSFASCCIAAKTRPTNTSRY
jgi:hypothetical protein